MGFSGQGYLSGLPCPLPGDLPDSGIKPVSPESPALQADSLCVLVTQLCPTLCNPMDCSAPGSSVNRIFQVRTLEWVAISFSRGSSETRDQTWVSYAAGRFFTNWATREALKFLVNIKCPETQVLRLLQEAVTGGSTFSCLSMLSWATRALENVTFLCGKSEWK